MEAGRKRLAGDTAREANTGEMQDLRREAGDLKEWLPNKPMKHRVGLRSRVADHCGRHHRWRTFDWECRKVGFGPSEAPEEHLIRKRLIEEGLRAAIPRLSW